MIGTVAEEECSQAAEGRDEEEENKEEDNVRSERDDKIDGAQDAHVHLEEGE